MTKFKSLRVSEGHPREVRTAAYSPNGRLALSGGGDDGTLRLWAVDWEWGFVEPAKWDDGAKPYLKGSLELHTPYGAALPSDRQPSEAEVRLALTRRGAPVWNDEEFGKLIGQLQCAGYGWLRPGDVKVKLEELRAARSGDRGQ